MQRIDYPYSLKNIAVPPKFEYQKQFVQQTSKFLRNLRYKAWFALNKGSSTKNDPDLNSDMETYGFLSSKAPPFVGEIKEFEKDVMNLVNLLEYRPKHEKSDFQKNLDRDLQQIKSVQEAIIPADKTRNFYKISKEEYEQMLTENITKDYRKAELHEVSKVDQQAAEIASNLGLSDRMEKFTKQDAFLTIKDHKSNFGPGRVSCRLINPAKSDIGRVAKHILQKINNEVCSATSLNQWRSTKETLDWFQRLDKDKSMVFIKFDIESFYPSISQDLLRKALKFAGKVSFISKEDQEIIMCACNAFLFSKGQPWKKKNIDNLFDVTMGSYCGAEVAETVGLYLLNKMTKSRNAPFEPKSVGLYRDDGLAAVKASGPQIDRKRKRLEELFREEGLKITVECNLKKTDYLDVVLDLEHRSFKPYRKPNDRPIYIHSKSNHPPNILQQLPKMIENRLTSISSSKEVFDSAKQPYENALRESGFHTNLTYNPKTKVEKRKRRRKILWFNPPYNIAVKTNVGELFLNLVKKHFNRRRNPVLAKIFNKNTIKVSYCVSKNMKSRLNKHNMAILHPPESETDLDMCSCHLKDKPNCPLQGNCLVKSVVYKAEVTAPGTVKKSYYGLTERTFKERYYQHTSSLRHEKNKNATELSKYWWELKNLNLNPKVTWSIEARAFTYRGGATHCDLCLTEKTVIALANPNSTLNSRTEMMGKCLHRRKFTLITV